MASTVTTTGFSTAVPSTFWVMSNGDFVLWVASGYMVSTNSGASWGSILGSAATSYVAICRSKTTNDKFYTLNYQSSNSPTTIIGYVLTYSTSTHTFTTTSSNTLVSLASGSFTFTSFCIFHDGTQVHTFWQKVVTGSSTSTFTQTLSRFTAAFTSAASWSATVATGTGTPGVYGGAAMELTNGGALLLAHPVITSNYTSNIRTVTIGGSSYTVNAIETTFQNSTALFVRDENNAHTVVMSGAIPTVLHDQVVYSYLEADPTSPTGVRSVDVRGDVTVYQNFVDVNYRNSSGTYSTWTGLYNVSGIDRVPVSNVVVTRQVNGSSYGTILAFNVGSNVYIWRFVSSAWTLKSQSVIQNKPSRLYVGLSAVAADPSAVTGTTTYYVYNDSTTINGNVTVYLSSVDINSAPTVSLTSPITNSNFDQTVDTITLTWAFADEDDSAQYQREVQVQKNVAGQSVYYVTAVGTIQLGVSTITTATTTAYISPNQLGASTTGFIWRVRVADAHGKWSPWSAFNSFTVAAKPTLTVTYPSAGEEITTSHPTVTWTYVDSDATNQSASRLRLYDATGGNVWDSGTVTTTTIVVSGGTGSQQLTYTLANNTPYIIGVLACDGSGTWTSETQFAVTTYFVFPAEPTISVAYDGNGVATVTVTANTPSSAQTLVDHMTIYRWSPRLNKYVLLANSANSSDAFTDIGVSANTTFRYKVVSYNTAGCEVSTISSDTSYTDEDWKLLTGTTVQALVVDSFTASPTKSEQRLEPMGRSTHIAFSFVSQGREGEIKFTLEDVERESVLATFFSMANTSADVYLRSPFGETFCVSLGSPSISYLGAGRVTVSVPFIETKDA